MPFDIQAVAKGFFDSAKVKTAVDAGTRKALMRQGGLIRTTARRSIRKATKKQSVSRPGQPPKTHKGTLRLIFFSFDPATHSVVVGPVIATARGGVVPGLLERGGDVTRERAVPKALARRAANRRQAEAYRRKVKDGSIPPPARERTAAAAHYEPRPYMGPAERLMRAKFAEAFRNTVG